MGDKKRTEEWYEKINKQFEEDRIRGSGHYIEVFYDDMRLKIEGNGTLEEFETMAKKISIQGKD